MARPRMRDMRMLVRRISLAKGEALDGDDDATRTEILKDWLFDDHEEY
jgi:hypothetical protein